MLRFITAIATVIASLISVAGAFVHPDDNHATPPWQEATPWPDRIVVTPGTDPHSSFSVTWRTDETVGRTIAQLAIASADARFDLGASSFAAKTERLVLDELQGPDGTTDVLENMHLPPAHFHSVTFTGLEENTLYAYRVRGQRGHWSPWRQVRTTPRKGPLRFVFFGDAQTAIRSHVTRSFDTAARVFPDPHFVIHGGDLVNTAFFDREWAEWFAAIGRTATNVPTVPVAGNHDYVNFDKHLPRDQDGKLFVARKSVSPIWRPQFTLPLSDSLPSDLLETVYDLQYGDQLHLFVLDSSGVAWDQQLDWLDGKLSETEARFTVVTMHHPLFSFVGGREHPAARDRRQALLRILRKGSVDLVLTGHRHTYQRSAFGEDVARFAAGDTKRVETVFVTTASSTKRGRTKVDGWSRYTESQDGGFQLTRYADNTPIFAVFELDGDTLSYQAIDAVGDVYDTFVLRKLSDGALEVVEGEYVTQAPRTYENTGPYKKWDDLR